MSEELKPCPFCGSENTEFDFEKWVVVCNQCLAKGPYTHYEPREEAAQLWNSRAEDKSGSSEKIGK